MSKIVHLRSGSFADETQSLNEDGTKIDKQAMLVYAGEFESMDGPVEIKDEDIELLSTNHNSYMSKLSRLATGEHHPKHNPPIQLDHSTSARDTVGRLVGNLTVGEHITEDGKTVKALFGTARVLGKENVEKVNDGRWTNLSGGFDLETHRVTELTITPFPAASEAALLSKKRRMTEEAEGEEMPKYQELKLKMGMYDKCKKRLMDKEELSAEEVDEKLAALSEEEVEKMSKEQDDEEKRLADEAAEDEKEKAEKKKDELKRMTALSGHKDKLVQLSKDIKCANKNVQLAAKKTSIRVRLSQLSANQKITPAEIKALDINEMAGKSDDVVNEVLLSYEKREPVIDTGLYGSTKALTAGQMKSQIKKLSGERNELLTRLRMKSKRADALKRLKELGVTEEELEKGVEVQGDTKSGGDVEFEAAYGEMKKLMGEGKEEEAKEYFRKHMTGDQETAMSYVDSDANAEMSSLAEEVKKMQTNFDEVVKLAAPLFGATPEELV